MQQATYQVRTYDWELNDYTPQVGLSLPWTGLTLWQLKRALRELRNMGYDAHRRRSANGEHEDNDSSVLVERIGEEIKPHWWNPSKAESTC